MIVVVDASASIKWFFQALVQVQDAEQAIALLLQVQSGQVTLVQPTHWLPDRCCHCAHSTSLSHRSILDEIQHE